MKRFRKRAPFLSLLFVLCILVMEHGIVRWPVFAGTDVNTQKVKRVRTGGCFKYKPKLIHRVEPVYPPLALDNKIEGIVNLEFLISQEGLVTKARVISGHPLLAGAARKAVMQWRYAPPRLKGEPVEVITNTSIGFVLPAPSSTMEEPLAKVNY